MDQQWYEPIPCADQDHEHREHIWTHPDHGQVECLGVRLSANWSDAA